jgi:hypothetical protein
MFLARADGCEKVVLHTEPSARSQSDGRAVAKSGCACVPCWTSGRPCGCRPCQRW